MTTRLLTRREIEDITGLTRSTIYRLMRRGAFPEPRRIGLRAVRWPESEIDRWLADRPRATGEARQ